MAKPIIPDKMSAQMRAGKAAAVFVEAKTEEVNLHTERAMGGDVEGIHDMRVAVKRLREALRLFRPVLPRKRRRRVMLDVEELNDALGRVRDPDVMMAHAAWVGEQDEVAREATDAASALWAEARQAALQHLIEVHQRITESQRLEGRLRQLVSAAAKRHRGPNDLPLDAFSYLAVTASAERVRDRLTRLGRDGDPTALHRIRIAVKRLKYSIEPFRTILPALDEAYRPVADTQEALGLVHDFDILEEALAGLSDGSSTEAALHIVRERRALHYSEALVFMALLGEEAWRRSLLDALD